MSKIVQKEIAIDGKVPQKVKERVCANLYEREIDFSDVPELTGWYGTPITQSKVENWVREVHAAVENGTARYVKNRDITEEERLLIQKQIAETEDI